MPICGINRCIAALCQKLTFTDGRIKLEEEDENDQEEREVERGSSTLNPPSHADFLSFLACHPEYRSAYLDELRLQEFKRLDQPNQRSYYLDYTGGGLYTESAVAFFAEKLTNNVFGNPHSTNPSSQLSSQWTAKAKRSVLDFVDANPEIYDLVWTSNATGAMKILAEGYDFQPHQTLVVGTDCHNSVNGMRAFAERGGADVEYLELPDDCKGLRGNMDNLKSRLKNLSTSSNPGLFVTTAQSNITGLKAPIMDLIPLASSLGFTTFLDAAALLPTSKLSVRSLNGSLDALGLSVYKIIGLPTGVGALIIKKTLLESLRKPWFCGGTVQLVQAPGQAVTMEQGPARFEDGTTDYLSTIAIPKGLEIVKQAMDNDALGKRLAALTYWTVHQLAGLLHQGTSKPLVLIRSPSLGLTKAEMGKLHGALIAFEVVDVEGEFVSCEVVEYAASLRSISLRAGCMCNPGGAATIMGMREMMSDLKSGETKKDIQAKWGVRAAGVTRVSFGLASNFADAWALVAFLKELTIKGELTKAVEAFYNKPRDVSAC